LKIASTSLLAVAARTPVEARVKYTSIMIKLSHIDMSFPKGYLLRTRTQTVWWRTTKPKWWEKTLKSDFIESARVSQNTIEKNRGIHEKFGWCYFPAGSAAENNRRNDSDIGSDQWLWQIVGMAALAMESNQPKYIQLCKTRNK